MESAVNYTQAHKQFLEVVLFMTEQKDLKKTYLPIVAAIGNTLANGAKVEQKIKESKK
jgi:hypothetical protein